MRKFMLHASAAITVIAAAQPVWAQTAPAAADAQDEAAAETEAAGIVDIIVTAQRFEDSAQKTPLVLSTLDSEALKGVTDARQLQTLSPGVQLAPAGNNVQTYVRGVGTFAATSNQESAIAYNADGVFLYATTMVTPLIYDLDRVEILKGPQGTLYGRNASGGAVNLITAGARLNRTEGYLEGEFGNYDLRRITGAVNLPLGETVAIRFAGQHSEHDGYLSDGTDDQNLTAGRMRLLWEATPDVTVQLRADASHAGGMGAGSTVNPSPVDDKFVGALDSRLQTGLPIPPFFGTSLLAFPPNPDPFFDNDQWSVSGQVDANLGFATLTVLPAYRYENSSARSYAPGYEVSEDAKNHQKSLEVRLANRTDALRWVLGAYYFKVDQTISQFIREEFAGLHIDDDFTNKVESYAFFGEGTYSVSDSFRLIGGLRYTHEKSNIAGTNNALSTTIPAFIATTTPAFDPIGEAPLDYVFASGARKSAITWKAGAEYDLSSTSLLFATASRGFKGGGTYIDFVRASFKPEYLTAFELGSRNRFLDNTLQINLEAFYWKLKDQQIPYLGFNSVNTITLKTENAGKANMYGGSADIIYKLTPDDTFHFAVEYVKSKYDEFTRIVPSFAVLPNTACSVTGYNATPGAQDPATVDCSGQSLLRAPKWSGSASYEHRFDLGNDSEVVVNGDMTFQSASFLDLNYTEQLKQDSVALFNARVTYRSPGDRFEVSGWIRNIGNEEVMAGGVQSVSFYARPGLMPPRTYGLSARVNF